jgi:hypothetical protein
MERSGSWQDPAELELRSAPQGRGHARANGSRVAAQPDAHMAAVGLGEIARSESVWRAPEAGLVALQRLAGNAAVQMIINVTSARPNQVVQRQEDEDAADVVAADDTADQAAGGDGEALECSCVDEDEAADVQELTPDASLDAGTAESQEESDLLQAQTFSLPVQRDAKAKPKKPKPVPYSLGCRTDAKACFSVSKKKAWLLDNGKVVAEVPALGGRSGHPTPVGKFTVENKDAKHASSKYKDKAGNPAPMPNYVQFAPQVGFHAGSLSQQSHGCVHLSPDGAKKFFDALSKGDKVDVVK